MEDYSVNHADIFMIPKFYEFFDINFINSPISIMYYTRYASLQLGFSLKT
jgi:hypothetical protein